ncbi:MAG: TonB family protein [Methylococcaceae bacterium]|nr:TonB family protein [Methylococcaceae bacterium]
MATTTPKHSFLQPAVSVQDSLLMTLFIAVIIHVVILLSVRFAVPQPDKFSKQIEITLATLPSKKAPKKADFLAQDNQIGGGVEKNKPEPTKQKIASRGDSEMKPPDQRQSQVENKPQAEKKLITQIQAEHKITITNKDLPPSELEKPKVTEESLRRQIAELGEQLRNSKKSSEKTRIKFVNSVSTHKSITAQYIKDWKAKVERVASLNYPEVAREFEGSLMMDVGINRDGTIYSIRITKSSGRKALDDAAKRIVRLSAPFPVLPAQLLEELDVLAIHRVWNFKDQSAVVR